MARAKRGEAQQQKTLYFLRTALPRAAMKSRASYLPARPGIGHLTDSDEFGTQQLRVRPCPGGPSGRFRDAFLKFGSPSIAVIGVQCSDVESKSARLMLILRAAAEKYARKCITPRMRFLRRDRIESASAARQNRREPAPPPMAPRQDVRRCLPIPGSGPDKAS